MLGEEQRVTRGVIDHQVHMRAPCGRLRRKPPEGIVVDVILMRNRSVER